MHTFIEYQPLCEGKYFALSKLALSGLGPWLELDVESLTPSREDVMIFRVSVMMHNIFKSWALIICIAFSPYSLPCINLPRWSCFWMLLFPERIIILIRKFASFTILPITALRTNMKGWFCLRFLVRYSGRYPQRNNKAQTIKIGTGGIHVTVT